MRRQNLCFETLAWLTLPPQSNGSDHGDSGELTEAETDQLRDDIAVRELELRRMVKEYGGSGAFLGKYDLLSRLLFVLKVCVEDAVPFSSQRLATLNFDEDLQEYLSALDARLGALAVEMSPKDIAVVTIALEALFELCDPPPRGTSPDLSKIYFNV